MPFDLSAAADVGIGALAGLAVGIEREWSGHASGPRQEFAGVRTFFILGLLAAVSGWLAGAGFTPLAIVPLVGAAVLALIAYTLSARHGGERVDGTTTAAALVVLALGAAAGLGYARLAAGATAVTVLVLYEKTRIHGLVRRLDQSELKAAFQFAVLALVILPLLPEGPYGPWGGVRPRALWTVVLLFSGINFAGYLARRAVGETAGYGVTGMLGGLVSSTLVALTFSPLSRKDATLARPLALGVVAACTVLLPRVLVVAGVLNPATTGPLLRYLWPPLLLGIALVATSLYREPPRRDTAPAAPPRNPLGVWQAVRMTLAFQLVLTGVHLVEGWFGSLGVLWSATALGLTDMDALTFAMARLGHRADMLDTATRAIAIGVLSNTLLKLGLTVGLGAPAFRRVASVGLALLAAASVVGLLIGG